MSFPGLAIASNTMPMGSREPSLLSALNAFSNCVLLFQAAYGVNPNGSSWKSLVGSVVANQTTAGLRPRMGSLNGRRAFTFDSVDDYFACDSPVTCGTCFVVSKYTDASFGDFECLLTGSLGDTGYPFRGNTATSWRTVEDSTSGANRFLDGVDTDAAAPGAPHVHELTYSTPQAKLFVIGENFAVLGAGNSWKGEIALIVVYSDVKSSGDRSSIRAILGSHYSIAVS